MPLDPKEMEMSLDEIVRTRKIRDNLNFIEMRRRRPGAVDVDVLDLELDEIANSQRQPADYANNCIPLSQYIQDADVTSNSSASGMSTPTGNKFNRRSMRDDVNTDDEDDDGDVKVKMDQDDVIMQDVNVKSELDDSEHHRNFVTVESANNIQVASQQWRLERENLFPNQRMPRLGFVMKGPTHQLKTINHRRQQHNNNNGQTSRWNQNQQNSNMRTIRPVQLQQAAEVHGTFVEKGNLSYKFGADVNSNERIIAIDRKIRRAGGPGFVNRAPMQPPAAPVSYVTNNYYITPAAAAATATSQANSAADAVRVNKEDIEQQIKASFAEYLREVQQMHGPLQHSTA